MWTALCQGTRPFPRLSLLIVADCPAREGRGRYAPWVRAVVPAHALAEKRAGPGLGRRGLHHQEPPQLAPPERTSSKHTAPVRKHSHLHTQQFFSFLRVTGRLLIVSALSFFSSFSFRSSFSFSFRSSFSLRSSFSRRSSAFFSSARFSFFSFFLNLSASSCSSPLRVLRNRSYGRVNELPFCIYQYTPMTGSLVCILSRTLKAPHLSAARSKLITAERVRRRRRRRERKADA